MDNYLQCRINLGHLGHVPQVHIKGFYKTTIKLITGTRTTTISIAITIIIVIIIIIIMMMIIVAALPLDGRKIPSIGEEDDGYKYLGVLEVDDIMHEVMKTNMKTEYIRRVKKVLTSKPKGGNVIEAIYSWTVSLL